MEDEEGIEAGGVLGQGDGPPDLTEALGDGRGGEMVEEDQIEATLSQKTHLVLPSDIGSPEELPPSQSRSSTLAEQISDRLH